MGIEKEVVTIRSLFDEHQIIKSFVGQESKNRFLAVFFCASPLIC